MGEKLEFSEDFKDEVAILEQTVLTYVEKLLPPLNELSKQYCVNIIPYLAFQIYLPLWLQSCFDLTPKIVMTAALGNIYGSMYFVIQDSVMDDPRERNTCLLPLANLFFVENLRCYHRLMPSDQRFWIYLRKYVEEYSQSLLWERQQHWGQIGSFSQQDMVLLWRKMSPLKCSAAILAVLAGQEEKVKLLSRAIELSEIGRQISDDIQDWREDLAAGNYTYPITLAAAQICKDKSIIVPLQYSESEIANGLFLSGLVESLFEESDSYYLKAQRLVEQLGCHYWVQYIDHHMQLNKEAKARIIRTKLETILGCTDGSP